MDSMKREVERLFREESKYVLATLIRQFGDIELAEDALQEALVVALEKWVREGIPNNCRGWILSVAKFKVIDALRRDQRLVRDDEALDRLASGEQGFDQVHEDRIEDDLLRLIFMCCHPALSLEAQVALTLREVCGLSTPEVASAFLVPLDTMAQRLVRSKRKLKAGEIDFELPKRDEMLDRVAGVLRVTYLVFNEGYYASSGEQVTSAELSAEAIRLGELLSQLLDDSEVWGLNALMLFSEARRAARASNGEIVLLEDQDRGLWDRSLIAKGKSYLDRALTNENPGSYTLQAAISFEHVSAPDGVATNWGRIIDLYDALDLVSPSPVVRLNRAVAVAMSGELEAGLQDVSYLISECGLGGYGLAHSARADLLRRLGNRVEAVASYRFALELSQQEPEKRFLRMRIAELEAS